MKQISITVDADLKTLVQIDAFNNDVKEVCKRHNLPFDIEVKTRESSMIKIL